MKTAKNISAERRHLTEELTHLGIRVYPGEANHLLPNSDTNLYEQLMARGIMVRDCSDQAGLSAGFVRIAVRTGEENDCLLTELKEVLK